MTTRLFNILAIGFLLFLWSCSKTLPTRSAPETLLNIIIVDQSESFAYADLSTVELSQLIQQDASNYSTWVAFVAVLEKKSLEQPLLLEGPFWLDTLPKNNYSIYQRSKIESRNQQKRNTFEQKLGKLLESYETISKLQNLPYSDVNGALQYALGLASQQRFAQSKIRIIIQSDLLHDLPNEKTLKVFSFPENAVIYPVNLNQSHPLEVIFPGNEVQPLVGFRADFFTSSH